MILAKPLQPGRETPAPRRGDLTRADRERIAWMLGDYVDLLELALCGDVENDAVVNELADEARTFAARLRSL